MYMKFKTKDGVTMKVKEKLNCFFKKSKISTHLLPVFLTVILMLILFFITDFFYNRFVGKMLFESQVLAFAENITNPTFAIKKIVLNSSAGASSNSEKQKDFWNLNIYQYTDIAFYIEPTDFSVNHTIKSLSINQISLWTKPSLGTPGLLYRNPYDFGKSTEIKESSFISDTLSYEILPPDAKIDYSKPQFYEDCSIPIVLEYLNKDIKTNHIIANNGTPLLYDGSLLKKGNITLSSIAANLSFQITIFTQSNEEYVCHVTLAIPLEDQEKNIYEGNYTQILDSVSNMQFYKLN